MSLLSWNCRGTGNLRTVKALEKVVNKEEPKIVFLMETKSKREWLEKVKERCKMKHGLIVPSDGSKGGLALLWKEGITVKIKTYSQDHIDAWIEGGWDGGCWHFTGFYGNPLRERPRCHGSPLEILMKSWVSRRKKVAMHDQGGRWRILLMP